MQTFSEALGIVLLWPESPQLIALVLGSFAAFALGKLRFKGKAACHVSHSGDDHVPGDQYSVRSLCHDELAEYAGDSVYDYDLLMFTLPFTVWVQTSFFKTLPVSILQSAYVDGASPFQTFYMILLPLTAPALVTTGLLAFINAWNEYLFALTFTSVEPESRTVTVAIALFTGKIARQEPFGEIMAAGVLVTIPLIVLV